MDGRHDELARTLVGEVCALVDGGEPGHPVTLAHLELLRAELLHVVFHCGDEAAAEAYLAVELVDAALRHEPVAAALAS